MKQLCVLGSLHLDVAVSANNLPQIDETIVGSEVNYMFGGKGGKAFSIGECTTGPLRLL